MSNVVNTQENFQTEDQFVFVTRTTKRQESVDNSGIPATAETAQIDSPDRWNLVNFPRRRRRTEDVSDSDETETPHDERQEMTWLQERAFVVTMIVVSLLTLFSGYLFPIRKF